MFLLVTRSTCWLLCLFYCFQGTIHTGVRQLVIGPVPLINFQKYLLFSCGRFLWLL